jgi:hypothetical protein
MNPNILASAFAIPHFVYSLILIPVFWVFAYLMVRHEKRYMSHSRHMYIPVIQPGGAPYAIACAVRDYPDPVTMSFTCGDIIVSGNFKWSTRCKKRADKFQVVGREVYCWNHECVHVAPDGMQYPRKLIFDLEFGIAEPAGPPDELIRGQEGVTEQQARDTVAVHQVMSS